MPAAFQVDAATSGKPAGWFDLVVLAGVTPSQPQTTLKEQVIAARDRIEKELARDPAKQQKAFQDLKQLATDLLISLQQDLPAGGEERIEKILADAGLNQQTPPASSGVAPGSHGGWTVILDLRSKRLELTPPKDAAAPTDEQIQLAADLARVARHLISLYAPDRVTWPFSILQPRPWGTATQDQYLERLEQIAKVGLGEQHAQVAFAKVALATIEAEIFILRGFAKRRWYLMKCAAYSAVATIISLVFYSEYVCHHLFDNLRPGACDRYRPIFLVFAGSMLGMWLSIASGRVAMSLESLEQVINDPVGAGLRVLFVLTVAFAGTVLLLSGMVEIKIGDFETKDLGWVDRTQNPMIALMIGILFGFSEKTLPNVLATRAGDFVRGLGSKDGKSG